MKFLLIASLFLVSSWGVPSGVPVVTQTPDVSVTEGETVNITCCWVVKFERMTVNWLKNQTVITIELLNDLNKSQASLQKERPGCSYLTFMNITREDSGRYTCRLNVEIPDLCRYEGNGTVVTVTARDNNNKDSNASGDNTNLPNTRDRVVLIYLLRCLPIIALISTFFCLHKLGTKARQRASAAPGNKDPAVQRTEEEEDQEEEEEERDKRETEAK